MVATHLSAGTRAAVPATARLDEDVVDLDEAEAAVTVADEEDEVAAADSTRERHQILQRRHRLLQARNRHLRAVMLERHDVING